MRPGARARPLLRGFRPLLLALAIHAIAAACARAHESPRVPIAVLTRQLSSRPGDVSLLLRRAELRRIDGDLAGARADLAEVARLEPGQAELPLARAALALDEGEPATARRLLDTALGTHPDDVHALRLRARALVALTEPRAVIADLSALIALAPRPHPDLFLERARLHMGLRDLDGARAGLDEARSRLGITASLELFAVELELEARRPEAARARLEALRVQYGDPRVLDGLAARIELAAGSAAPEPLQGEPPAPSNSRAPASGATARGAGGPKGRPRGLGAVQAIVTRGPYLQVGTPTAITVRWRTDSPEESWVRYGTFAGSLTSVASDATLTIEHEVRLTGLSPATRYYYSVGTAGGPLAGDASFTFQTAPPAGSGSGVRLWAIGDSGLPSAAAFAVHNAYLAWTGARGTDLWLMLGDNAYQGGTDAEYQTAVFNQYPAMLRQSVLWPTRGNHDGVYAGANNDYYDIFTMPTAGEAGGLPSGSEAYYSFDWADIHFVCLDSEGSDRSPGGAMLTWLANDLAANTRKFVIAYWHHPPYTKGSHDSDNAFDSGGRMRDMRQYALPILEAGGADLMLTGHSHSYERSYLLDGHYGLSTTLQPSMIKDVGDGRPNGDGGYVKWGASPIEHGGAVHAVAGSSSQVSGGTLNHPVMVTSLNVSGSMVLDFHDEVVLDARFLDTNGAVLDSFRIIKPGPLGVPGDGVAARDVRLGPGLPNPFTLDLRMGYTLARAGRMRLEVLDLSGRRIATLEDGWREAGPHEARWDGRDAQGRAVPGGVYVAVLQAHGERVSRKIFHVR